MEKNNEKKWIGTNFGRKEDELLLQGKGNFTDDLKFADLCHAAILRSPHPHARICEIRTDKALALPGVIDVLTGSDVGRMSSPFPTGMPSKMDYYSTAVEKVRFVGESVAVVVAKDRYVAEDACELIEVDYERLSGVTDQEEAMGPGAPILHDKLGTNVANHRLLRYGDIDQAFADADLVVQHEFRFHKYSSTPVETCVVIASYDQATEVLTLWSNFHGPFALHSFVAKGLKIPENKLRFIVPRDIGGSFGIKIGITSYLVLIGLAAKRSGKTVKWVEDRREHLTALSSGAERKAFYELAARRDGTILGVRSTYIDNNGAYVRAPEPANLYRTTGNTLGPYKIRNLEIDAYAVMTNKSPTGPNRGYGCQQLYFCLESMVDRLARELELDPAALRLHNFIEATEFPYRTASGGLYDSGDYSAGLSEALAMADYEGLKRQRETARKEGRLFGIGLVSAVEPCVSNMGYLNLAFAPEMRAREDFHAKSGAGEAAVVKMDPMGRVTAILGSTPSGQGHEALVAQVIADELGVRPDDINVVTEMDTFTRFWTISSGNYSSRFASAGLSAFAQAARKLRRKVLNIAAHRFNVPANKLTVNGGQIFQDEKAEMLIDFRGVAGLAHWNPTSLPDGIGPGLEVTHLFNFPQSSAIDDHDRVNSSSTYGFIAEVAAVEVDRDTGEIKIIKYISVHDAGTIINPQRVEGQIYGSLLHGLGGAIYEELAYDEDGNFLTSSFNEYLCPTAPEAPSVEIGHVSTKSPFSVLGTKGCGEGSAMAAPALLTNALNDALSPLGVSINQLPLTPSRVWQAIQAGMAEK
ncbi:Carbon monoxide dehydrogenase large chain (EC [Olavius algarvensis Delta 1 endosymbiont]|nr:Carbon monoxide dehydrogenase large chain (EC [Olavius algarvensis Delta 1 endosymbiont]